MAFKALALTILLVSLTFKPSLSESLNDCPNDPSGDVPIVDISVKKDGVPFMYQDERIRIPANGIFDKPITCILITDNGSGGHVKIIDAGVGFNYVVLEIISEMAEGLDFEIVIYIEK